VLETDGKKGKGRYSSSWEPHLRAAECHLPYGITQCYLLPDTSELLPLHSTETKNRPKLHFPSVSAPKEGERWPGPPRFMTDRRHC